MPPRRLRRSVPPAPRALLGRKAAPPRPTGLRPLCCLRGTDPGKGSTGDKSIWVVQVGGKGGVNAYVASSRVAWANRRDQLPTAMSTATVIADAGEQDSIGTQPLRALPALYPREAQLPHEPVEPQPPSQPELLGVEPPPLPPCAWARSWTWLLVRSSKNAPAW